MSMYYKEEIEKDTIYRDDYSKTIDAFLAKEHAKTCEQRASFITPSLYMQDTEK